MQVFDKLQDASLERVPQQEVEVIFLFSQIFRNYGFIQVKQMQSQYPDCIAYRKTNSGLKEVRIEFEYQSFNFYLHNHDPRKCDCIVCWEHNWHDLPDNLEVIELRQQYGFSPKIWVMAVGNKFKEELAQADEHEWSVASKCHSGDLILFYHTSPDSCIKEIFKVDGQLSKASAGEWTKKKQDVFAHINRIVSVSSPLFYEEMKNDRVLSKSAMVKMHMQGRFEVTEYWHRIFDMIVRKNPKLKSDLSKYSPEKIYR